MGLRKQKAKQESFTTHTSCGNNTGPEAQLETIMKQGLLAVTSQAGASP
jgi:hypothetical protein